MSVTKALKWTGAVLSRIYLMITTQAGITNISGMQASECIVSKTSVQRIRDRTHSEAKESWFPTGDTQ